MTFWEYLLEEERWVKLALGVILVPLGIYTVYTIIIEELNRGSTVRMVEQEIVIGFQWDVPDTFIGDLDTMMPMKAHKTDSAYDIRSLFGFTISPGSQISEELWFRLEMPIGYEMRLHLRSGHARERLRIHNGLIDCDYRGIVAVLIENNGTESYVVEPGERFIQMSFHRVLPTRLERRKTLGTTARGNKGFGDTGKQ